MSILIDKTDANGRYVKDSVKEIKANPKKDVLSTYFPTPEEVEARNLILKDFRLGWQTMHLQRPELNDLSLYQRHVIDMLAFNTYQENDGAPAMEDRLGGWKSQAMRPVIRNKAVSIAAHETARLTIPKIFAYNNQNDEQEDSAKVMSYLVDWAREQANYSHMSLFRVIQSLYSPISWGLSEYTEVYRSIKDERGADGKWSYKEVLDEDESGFKHTPIPTDQVYFGNFYERDCQKQDFLLLRRIISYDRVKLKYGKLKNFENVKPGVVVTMDDANKGFYQVYDPHMRQEDVEELIYWRKSTDVKLIMLNGILCGECDEANPRNDKQYPFDKFYYLPINERCIAGKSLVFAMQSDANITNTLYQMVIDGTYLNLFPPTVQTGSDKVGADVMIPGMNIAFSDKDVEIKTLRTADGNSLSVAMNTLEKVERSISETSQDPIQQGQIAPGGGASTAYEISRIEQNAATVLGLSMKFIAQHAIDYGRLLVSDVLQYLTIVDVESITENKGLLYKTFFAREPGKNGKMNKISFSNDMPDTMTDDEKLAMSYEILKKQGGIKSNTTLWQVNPALFRNLKYINTVDSDVMNPRSTDLIRAFDLETYDRAIANPVADQEKIFVDLLMSTNPKTSRDPKAYVKKEEVLPPQMMQQQTNGGSAPAPIGNPSPAKVQNQNKLPQNI